MFLKILKRVLLGLCAIAGAAALVVIVLNLYMFFSTFTDIKSVDEAAKLEDVDCILVLGAGVRPGGKPSLMLQDRLDKAVELYEAGVSDRIIVSGDHRENDYNEVQVMKDYLIEQGIPSEAIFMDHAGLSTYDSMYRADYIFGVKRAVIVTQEYHMYRAIADAEAMGIDAYGVCAKKVTYNGQLSRDIREIAARVKDVVYGIMKPEATVLGDSISLDESGDITND